MWLYCRGDVAQLFYILRDDSGGCERADDKVNATGSFADEGGGGGDSGSARPRTHLLLGALALGVSATSPSCRRATANTAVDTAVVARVRRGGSKRWLGFDAAGERKGGGLAVTAVTLGAVLTCAGQAGSLWLRLLLTGGAGLARVCPASTLPRPAACCVPAKPSSGWD
jgi:hypothetical protein